MRQYRMEMCGIRPSLCGIAAVKNPLHGLDVIIMTSTYEFMKKCEGGKRNAKKR